MAGLLKNLRIAIPDSHSVAMEDSNELSVTPFSAIEESAVENLGLTWNFKIIYGLFLMNILM